MQEILTKIIIAAAFAWAAWLIYRRFRKSAKRHSCCETARDDCRAICGGCEACEQYFHCEKKGDENAGEHP